MRSLFLFFPLLLAIASCSPTPEQANKLRIVCTTSIIGDAIANITDTNFQVVSLMLPGTDPHLYKATPKDLELLKNADVIIYNGLHLEGKMQDIFQKLQRHKKIIAISDGINPTLLRSGDNISFDPHIWLDASLWKIGIAACADSLKKQFPQFTSSINETDYLSKLEKLHQHLIATANQLTVEKRILITAHDAFGYFGQAYGFKVMALKGTSTVTDVNIKHLHKLTQFIIENKIKAIFPETSVPENNIAGIIDACQKAGHTVKIGKTLYSDALGFPNTAEGTYIGMIQYNMNALITDLQ